MILNYKKRLKILKNVFTRKQINIDRKYTFPSSDFKID